MNKFRNIYIYAIIIISLAIGGCSSTNTEAKDKTVKQDETQNIPKNTNEISQKTNSPEKVKLPNNIASVAGKYNYKTYKNGEGYDNSLEIEDKGEGKLHVSLSGSYIYTIDDHESMHEAGGEGTAQFRENTAIANITDEADKPCLVTINFSNNQANVKIPDTCQFNIALDGIYKKGSTNSAEKQTKNTTKVREVSFDKLADFVNDFDKHRVGESYIITNVPSGKIEKHSRADAFGNREYKGFFYLESNDDDGGAANGFLTTAAMIKSLDANGEYEPAKLRVYAVLAESLGEFDVYRISLVTKIEGLNDDGTVLWTASGGQPSKIKFKH